MVGYGAQPPNANWPNRARIAVQFVINYEEGAENNILHGDAGSETFLSEIIGAASYPDRHMSMESLYEYGSRAGFWRLHRLFNEFAMPVTVYGVAMALQRNPDVVEAILKSDWEIASHGLRWIDYQFISEEVERAHMALCREDFRRGQGSEVAQARGQWRHIGAAPIHPRVHGAAQGCHAQPSEPHSEHFAQSNHYAIRRRRHIFSRCANVSRRGVQLGTSVPRSRSLSGSYACVRTELVSRPN